MRNFRSLVTVVVCRDSDADGVAEATDELVEQASVSLTVTGPGVNQTFAGATGAGKKTRGVFSTGWMRDLADGTYTEEVTSLAHDTFTWNPALDPMGNDTDLDGDNLPDRAYTIPR